MGTVCHPKLDSNLALKILNCLLGERGLEQQLVLKKFGIKQSMRVMISFSNIPGEAKKNEQGALPFWVDSSFSENWQDIYDNNKVFPTQNESLMILNGVDIIQMRIMKIEDLSLDHVIMIYIHNMWTKDLDYQQTLEANHYYETSPYVAKKNQKSPKRGKYKSVSHGYLAHGGTKSKGNVVKYHQYKIPDSIQKSFKGLGDSIASSIWMELDQFGSQVQ